MHVFFAVSGSVSKTGTLLQLHEWSMSRINSHQAKLIKILKARPNDSHARVIMEISHEGITLTPSGRILELKALRKSISHGIKKKTL